MRYMMILTVGVCLLILSSSVAKNSDTAGAAIEENQIVVRVAVWDETEKNKLAEKAEIWFRGHGSWWLQQAAKNGGDVKDLGKRAAAETDKLFIYPDGRDGKEISVSIKMTESMCPNGCARDQIHVTITDSKVTVLGNPIKAANDEVEIEFERR